MKKLLLTAALAASVLAVGEAKAEWYGNLSSGAMFLQSNDATLGGNTAKIEYDTGYSVYAALGHKFAQGFRIEGELGYGQSSFESLTVNGVKYSMSGDIDIITGTVNGFYDFKTGTAFTPYVGAGMGFARTETTNINVAGFTSSGNSETDFTALGEAGVNYAVNQKISVGAAYRYNHLFNGSNGFDDDAAHIVKANLRVGF